MEVLVGREGKEVIDQLDEDGRTPLHWAAAQGDSTIANLLLNEGAVVNVKDAALSYIPLHLAAERGYQEIVCLLLAKEAAINEKGGKKSRRPCTWQRKRVKQRS